MFHTPFCYCVGACKLDVVGMKLRICVYIRQYTFARFFLCFQLLLYNFCIGVVSTTKFVQSLVFDLLLLQLLLFLLMWDSLFSYSISHVVFVL
jgi:hypothetical protein